MKNILPVFLFFAVIIWHNSFAQNIGIRTSTPTQALDVNGKLRIGNDNTAPIAGTVRYNAATADFEGFNGTEWRSLTASGTSTPFINAATIKEKKGNAMAIDGDIAAIGAPAYMAPNIAGVVYIYQRINNSWVQLQMLSEPQGGFGEAVALYGDYLVVGTPFYSSPYGRGKITLYKKINGQFVFATHYFPTVIPTGEYFGCSLSMHGGLIAVGCISRSRGYVSPSNRVHILSILNAGLQPEQVVYNPNAPNQEDFGISLAIDSTKLIVGAPKANVFGSTARGRVYVYAYAGANTYSFTNSVEYSAYGASDDNFGEDLALHGNSLVIGCPGLDINPLFNIGAFFICNKDAGGNFLSSALSIYTHPFDTPETFMGKSVAVHNNIILAGSNKAVYQYIKINGTWQFHKTLSASLPGIASIDAVKLAINGQSYGVGSPLYNSNDGRFVLGDCRY